MATVPTDVTNMAAAFIGGEGGQSPLVAHLFGEWKSWDSRLDAEMDHIAATWSVVETVISRVADSILKHPAQVKEKTPVFDDDRFTTSVEDWNDGFLEPVLRDLLIFGRSHVVWVPDAVVGAKPRRIEILGVNWQFRETQTGDMEWRMSAPPQLSIGQIGAGITTDGSANSRPYEVSFPEGFVWTTPKDVMTFYLDRPKLGRPRSLMRGVIDIHRQWLIQTAGAERLLANQISPLYVITKEMKTEERIGMAVSETTHTMAPPCDELVAAHEMRLSETAADLYNHGMRDHGDIMRKLGLGPKTGNPNNQGPRKLTLGINEKLEKTNPTPNPPSVFELDQWIHEKVSAHFGFSWSLISSQTTHKTLVQSDNKEKSSADVKTVDHAMRLSHMLCVICKQVYQAMYRNHLVRKIAEELCPLPADDDEEEGGGGGGGGSDEWNDTDDEYDGDRGPSHEEGAGGKGKKNQSSMDDEEDDTRKRSDDEVRDESSRAATEEIYKAKIRRSNLGVVLRPAHRKPDAPAPDMVLASKMLEKEAQTKRDECLRRMEVEFILTGPMSMEGFQQLRAENWVEDDVYRKVCSAVYGIPRQLLLDKPKVDESKKLEMDTKAGEAQNEANAKESAKARYNPKPKPKKKSK